MGWQIRQGSVVLWTGGLLGEPEDEVGAPVPDVAADLEAAGSAAEVAPIAQRAFGDAEEGAGFLEGEHLVAGVAARVADGGLSGHGMTPCVMATVGRRQWGHLPQEAGAHGFPVRWRISPTSDNGGVERPTIIELARRGAGLTQTELARRAGTTQSVVSMYERRRKVPMLDVAERLMQAAGADLGMVTTVLWEVDFLPGLKAFHYPDRLWRVEVPGCFDTVRMPDMSGAPTGEWNLRDHTDRPRLYENLLVEGSPQMMQRWVDGALLVDVWADLELPTRIRAAWEPAVAAASTGGGHGVFQYDA